MDASELAVAQARENAELNGVSGTTTFQCADVFDLLPELEARGEQFDVVILDPPAFTNPAARSKMPSRATARSIFAVCVW